MGSIRTVDQAIDAVCNDCLFFVAGQYVRPSTIVRVTIADNPNKAGEQVPTFHLSDGSDVTHDPTLQGDVGDLLGDALCYIERGGNDSVRFNDPLFTGALIVPNEDHDRLRYYGVGEPFTKLKADNFSNSTNLHHLRYDAYAERLLFLNQSTGKIVSIGINGGSSLQNVFDTGGSSSASAKSFTVDKNDGRIYYLKDTAGSISFERVESDGTSSTELIAAGASTWNPNDGDGAREMLCDPNDRLIFIATGSFNDNGVLYRYDIADDTVTELVTKGSPPYNLDYGAIDTENKKLYIIDSSDLLFVYDYDGNEQRREDLEDGSFGLDGIAVNPYAFNGQTGIFVGRPDGISGSIYERITVYTEDFKVVDEIEMETGQGGNYSYQSGFRFANGVTA